MKTIKLYWYRHKEGYGNFGDALNPYIIEKLSRKKVKYFNISLFDGNIFLNFKVLIMQFFKRKINFSEFLDYSIYNVLRNKKIILGIGSILCFRNGKNILVWGSGIIEKNANFGNANFIAVRGHYTESRLKELNYNLPLIFGDPALLLPKIFHPTSKQSFKIGIIPHFIHYNELKSFDNNNIKIINLIEPIEKIINDINSCKFIISTSLHGLIVSHAYQIPALWVDFHSNKKLQGDNIKFKDYFSSVHIDAYNPFSVQIPEFSISEIIDLFDKNKNIAIPNETAISEIQTNLIKCAPFYISPKYKS